MNRLVIVAAVLFAPLVSADPIRLSVGVSAFDQADGRWGMAPELGGRLGLSALGSFELGIGARFWFRGLEQPELPRGLALEERDLGGSAEMTLTRNWMVRPALTVGAGAAIRFLDLVTSEQVHVRDAMTSRRELVPTGYAQFAVGIPLGRAQLVLEPFIRYQRALGDDRLAWSWGLELSTQLGG